MENLKDYFCDTGGISYIKIKKKVLTVKQTEPAIAYI